MKAELDDFEKLQRAAAAAEADAAAEGDARVSQKALQVLFQNGRLLYAVFSPQTPLKTPASLVAY